jgi:hypothetical protein
VRIICKVEFGLSCIMVHGEEDVDDELCFFFGIVYLGDGCIRWSV